MKLTLQTLYMFHCDALYSSTNCDQPPKILTGKIISGKKIFGRLLLFLSRFFNFPKEFEPQGRCATFQVIKLYFGEPKCFHH